MRVDFLNGLDAHDVDEIGLEVIRGVAAFRVSTGIRAVDRVGHPILPNAVHPYTFRSHVDTVLIASRLV